MTICKKCREESKGVFAGQGFRDFICQLCGNTDTWCNTDVPKFCYDCSNKLNMCQRCGGPVWEEGGIDNE